MRNVFPEYRALLPTEIEPLKPSELDPVVARERLERAVANCARIKLEATQRAAAMAGLEKEDFKKPAPARSAESTKRSNSIVGEARKAAVHAEWNGLTRREYTTKLSQARRARLYAQGLTSRGTQRVIPAPVAFNKPWARSNQKTMEAA